MPKLAGSSLPLGIPIAAEMREYVANNNLRQQKLFDHSLETEFLVREPALLAGKIGYEAV